MEVFRKWRLIIPLLILFHISVTGQLINYDSGGKHTKAYGEEVSIVINKKTDNIIRGIATPISLPGVINGVFGLSVDVIKSILSAEEAKYTASYSATKSEKGLLFLSNPPNMSSADLDIISIELNRKIINSDETKELATVIRLIPVVEAKSGLFRFKIDYLSFPFTKAKIRKHGKMGKTLDVGITIKMDAYWKEYSGTAKTKDSILNGAYQIKTASLGESTILITSIKPGKTVYVNPDLYSGWFQLIPSAALQLADENNKWRVGYYTVTITVKEANPYGINSKQLSDYFNAGSSDLNNLFKQLVPGTSK